MDIDEILAQSKTFAYKTDPTNELSSFAKATFAHEEEDQIDWNDQQFWDKLLPSFKTSNKILDLIKNEPESLDKEEIRNQIFNDLNTLMEDVKFQNEHKSMFSSYDPSGQMSHIIKKLGVLIVKFSDDQKKTISEWTQALDKPRYFPFCYRYIRYHYL